MYYIFWHQTYTGQWISKLVALKYSLKRLELQSENLEVVIQVKGIAAYYLFGMVA